MIKFIFLFILFIFLFFISSTIKNKNVKKFITIFSLLILCFISGTRYNTGGSDYFVYKEMYDNLDVKKIFFHWFSFNNYGIEPGFVIYMSIIKIFNLNFYGFTLINSIVFYSLLYVVLRKYDYNINFILVFFLYKFFFYNTFISMRQPLSILIFWLSLPYLKEKKYLRYYILCCISLLFHRSAIVLFLIPFVTHFDITKKKFIGIISICLAIYVLKINTIPVFTRILQQIFINDTSAISQIERYSSGNYGMSIFYLLEYLLISFTIILRYDKIYNYDDNSSFFLKLFVCLIPFYTVFSSISVVTRLKDYFFLSYPIMTIYICKSQKKMALFIYMFTIAICLYGYLRYMINFDNGALFEYRSFIFENISIFNYK